MVTSMTVYIIRFASSRNMFQCQWRIQWWWWWWWWGGALGAKAPVADPERVRGVQTRLNYFIFMENFRKNGQTAQIEPPQLI